MSKSPSSRRKEPLFSRNSRGTKVLLAALRGDAGGVAAEILRPGARRKAGPMVWLLACLSAVGFFAAPQLLDGDLRLDWYSLQRVAQMAGISVPAVAPKPTARATTKPPGPVLSGTASVIDGDTLDIHGQRIRLHGIDAPESRQTCLRRGQAWRCGQAAAIALSDRIGRSPVTCHQTDIDRYKRVVARCWLGDEDLNRWMVLEGHAVAYRQYGKDYIPDEDAARLARRGIWAGEFTMPWDWRKGARLSGESGA